jgi:hypothetical protein
MRQTLLSVATLAIPLAATVQRQTDVGRIIAQTDSGRVLYRMIVCELPHADDCHAREQQRLDRRIQRQWIDAAVRLYGVSLTSGEETAVAGKVDAESADLDKAAVHFRLLADAALKIRRGEDRGRVQSDLLGSGVAPSELEWELDHLPTIAAAERTAAKDFGAEVREAARKDYAQPFILDHLRRIVAKRAVAERISFETAEEEFWSGVARSSHTRIIDPAFRLPEKKGILAHP